MNRLSVPLACALVMFAAALNAQAAVLGYTASLTGDQEVPPVVTGGSGSAVVTYDNVAHTLHVQVNFNGLTGTTTAAHIHGPATFGVNAGIIVAPGTLTGFPVGVTSGSYDNTFDLTDTGSYNAAFVTANGGTAASAEAALAAHLADGLTYFNIHTSAFPGGEIRGQLLIPEPAGAALLALPLAATLLRRRRSHG